MASIVGISTVKLIQYFANRKSKKNASGTGEAK